MKPPASVKSPRNDAVVVGRVADAVGVERDRLVEAHRGVAEVDDDRVADLGLEGRAGHLRRAGRLGEAGLHELVDERAEGALARGRAIVPLVAARRRDVPLARARRDPVLALAPAGLGLGRGEGEVVLRHRAGRALHLGGERVGLAGGVRVVEPDLVAADRAQEGGTGWESGEERRVVLRSGIRGVRLPTSCQQAGASLRGRRGGTRRWGATILGARAVSRCEAGALRALSPPS